MATFNLMATGLLTTLLFTATDGAMLRGLPAAVPEQPADAAVGTPTATFVNPMVKNLPIDYCMTYNTLEGPERLGDGCGEKAATRYCQDQGFAVSTHFDAYYYSNQATYILGMEQENPRHEQARSKGFHTFFHTISCSTDSSSAIKRSP